MADEFDYKAEVLKLEKLMAKQELYFNIDIETVGPYPIDYSMVSFGVSATTADGKEVATFEANLEELPEAGRHPDTMEWWKGFPEAWKHCRKDPEDPVTAMSRFVDWVDEVCGKKYKPVAVAMPSTFDYMFMYVYMLRYAGRSPFSFSCVDMKSVAMTLLGKGFRASGKRSWPKRWFADLPHTHKALDDAREQGQSFVRMLKDRDKNQ